MGDSLLLCVATSQASGQPDAYVFVEVEAPSAGMKQRLKQREGTLGGYCAQAGIGYVIGAGSLSAAGAHVNIKVVVLRSWDAGGVTTGALAAYTSLSDVVQHLIRKATSTEPLPRMVFLYNPTTKSFVALAELVVGNTLCRRSLAVTRDGLLQTCMRTHILHRILCIERM